MATFTTSLPDANPPTLNNTIDDSVLATWEDVTDNGQYQVQIKNTSVYSEYGDSYGTQFYGNEWPDDEAFVGHDTTDYEFTDLQPNTEYEVRLRTTTGSLDGEWTEPVSITVVPPITNLQVERNGVWVDITWDENANDEDGFRLYRSVRDDPDWPGDYGEIADLSTNTTEYEDPLLGGTVVHYALVGYEGSTETVPLFYEFDPCEDEDITDELARGLPDFFPNGGDSGNYHLLEGIGHALECQEVDLDVVEAISSVQNARTQDELRLLGALINTPPRGGEDLEVYRARLEGEYAKLTSEGTIQDLINSASQILEVSTNRIGYLEAPDTNPGVIQVGLPGNSLDEHELTESELVEIFEELIAGSYEIQATRSGTFTYITPSDYTSGNHTTGRGYSGLDAGGDPNDTGGTYAGVI